MIKQFVLTVEAPDESLIDTFISMLNKQAEATRNITPIKIFVEEQKIPEGDTFE